MGTLTGLLTGRLTYPLCGNINRLPWMVPSAEPPGPTLSFLASFYDGDNEFVLQALGTGTPTTPHIATMYAKGADGFHHEFGANKHVISGGRYVDEDTVYATDSGDNLLDPLPLTVAQPAGINSQIHSRDQREATYTKVNMDVAKDVEGLDASVNGSCTLTATSANATCIANAITAASGTHANKHYLKRKTGTGVVELTVDGGTTWQPVTVTSDMEPLAVDQATVTNPQIGIRIVTSGDEITVGNAEAHLASTKEKILNLLPIFTDSASEFTDPLIPEWDVTNLPTDFGGFYIEAESDGDQVLLGSFLELFESKFILRSINNLDSFTDTDNVLIENHTPENGGAWAVLTGGAKIHGNRLQATSSLTRLITPRKSDGFFQFKTYEGADAQGIIFRITDINNHWRVTFAKNAINLQKIEGGALTTEATFARTKSSGDVCAVRVDGTDVRVYDNDTEVISTTISAFNQTATDVGIYLSISGNEIDDFKIYGLNGSLAATAGINKLGGVYGEGKMELMVGGEWTAETTFSGTLYDGTLNFCRDALFPARERGFRGWDSSTYDEIKAEITALAIGFDSGFDSGFY